LAASSTVKEHARAAAPAARCTFIDNGAIETLLTHAHPVESLKQHVRAQIGVLSLVPYDIIHPAAPNMFFGRRDLLDRFHAEETVSFAVAGPGRIGKSSMLEQYRFEIRKNPRDDRRDRLCLIDCYPHRNLDDHSLAQRIALDISAKSEAFKVNLGTFLRFLKRHSLDGQRPIELLLDEVDAICDKPLFEEIAQAVRWGFIRLIACGRGGLHRMMRRKDTQLAHRLELIRPEPLDEVSAERLLREPLRDLGFEFENIAAIRAGVFDLTHRKPQMIHICAKRMLELARRRDSTVITLADLAATRAEMLAIGDELLPLDALQNDLTRLLMLMWLRAGGGRLTVTRLQELADSNRLRLSANGALDICYDLWICNVLTLERGTFMLADMHLVDHVRRMDFNREIERLKRVVNQTSNVFVSFRT
jgi:hypothetical protein